MNREALEHLIRAAAEVTNEYEFVIVGSQSILGPIPNPPRELTMSMEADIYPMNAEEKSDKIDGALGESRVAPPATVLDIASASLICSWRRRQRTARRTGSSTWP
ncbi:hypothetical protein [Caenimonas sp. SL110]|uniref:hypothetical protein n=1 Tax=Caenimonas sp. SL110 TaxID=1450524 RepID=UPI000B08C477